MFETWPINKRVMVNLTDGSAIEGVMLRKRGPVIVFADAVLMSVDAEPVRMDGEVYIERVNVRFLQAR